MDDNQYPKHRDPLSHDTPEEIVDDGEAGLDPACQPLSKDLKTAKAQVLDYILGTYGGSRDEAIEDVDRHEELVRRGIDQGSFVYYVGDQVEEASDEVADMSESDQLESIELELRTRIDKALAELRALQPLQRAQRGDIDNLINILEGNA